MLDVFKKLLKSIQKMKRILRHVLSNNPLRKIVNCEKKKIRGILSSLSFILAFLFLFSILWFFLLLLFTFCDLTKAVMNTLSWDLSCLITNFKGEWLEGEFGDFFTFIKYLGVHSTVFSLFSFCLKLSCIFMAELHV